MGSGGDWSPSRRLVLPHILMEILVWGVMRECRRKYQAGVHLGLLYLDPRLSNFHWGFSNQHAGKFYAGISGATWLLSESHLLLGVCGGFLQMERDRVFLL